jgi:acyl-CoA thioesterase
MNNDLSQTSLNEIPFLHDLGVDFVGMNQGEAEVSLVLLPRHMNSWQVAHGGVSMAMLDIVMSMAGRSLDPNARAGVTIEMKTSFLQPAGKIGERLLAKGRVVHRSATICFCNGEIWNGTRLVAQATGSFKYRKRIAGADGG